MPLAEVSSSILGQLSAVIAQVSPEDFKRPSSALSEATLGQHLRHTLEFFICLERGVSSGVVNYDSRDHDRRMENDKLVALEAIDRINAFVRTLKSNHPLVLKVRYNQHNNTSQSVDTNIFRELTYNIEHAVHHMAMIKIGLREVAPYIDIPSDFGVAASTLRHRASMLEER